MQSATNTRLRFLYVGLQNYLAGISGEYGGTSQAVGAGGPSPAMGDNGSVSEVIGAAAITASDVRVKENIAPAGKWKGS